MGSHVLIRYFILFFEKFLEQIPDLHTSSLNEWLTFKKYLEYFPSSQDHIHSLLEHMFKCDKKTTLDQLENIKTMSKSKWLLNFRQESENHIPQQKKEEELIQSPNRMRQSKKKFMRQTSEKNNVKNEKSPDSKGFSNEKSELKSVKAFEKSNSPIRQCHSQKNLTFFNPFLAIRTLSNRTKTEIPKPPINYDLGKEQQIIKNHRRSKSNILCFGLNVINYTSINCHFDL